MSDKLPEFLIEMLEKQYDKDDCNRILEGYKCRRPVTFRVNKIKSNTEEIENELINLKMNFKKVSWYEDAYILENVCEKDIEILDIYKNGEIYLQSLSSMLPPIVLGAKEEEDILDMAAAPGGKTTQIAAMTQNKANITACEMNKLRAERLKYNVEKQGASSTYIMIKDSRNIEDFFSFDRILLDAPCSGSGTLSTSNNNLGKYFTKKLIEKSTKTQLALLKKALKVLKQGNEMIYSTCSILGCENEEILDKVLKECKAEIVPINLDGIEELPLLPTKIKGTICVCPNELYEGFFIAKIKKQ